MKRLIVNYEDTIDLHDAMVATTKVIEQGHITKDNTTFFAACTVFTHRDGYELLVFTERTATGNDTFKILSREATA